MYLDNRIKNNQCPVSLEERMTYLLSNGITLTFSATQNENDYKEQIVDLLSSSFFSRISKTKESHDETATSDNTK